MARCGCALGVSGERGRPCRRGSTPAAVLLQRYAASVGCFGGLLRGAPAHSLHVAGFRALRPPPPPRLPPPPCVPQRTTETRCPAGTYCTGGVKYDCGDNELYCPVPGDGTGLTAPVAVPSGYFSSGGTTTTVSRCGGRGPTRLKYASHVLPLHARALHERDCAAHDIHSVSGRLLLLQRRPDGVRRQRLLLPTPRRRLGSVSAHHGVQWSLLHRRHLLHGTLATM